MEDWAYTQNFTENPTEQLSKTELVDQSDTINIKQKRHTELINQSSEPILINQASDPVLKNQINTMPISRSRSMWAVSPTSTLSLESRSIRSDSILSLTPDGQKKSGKTFLKRRRSTVPTMRYTAPPCLSGDMDAIDSEGKSLIFYAARYGQTDTAEQLIEAGCDMNQKDNYGNTPLHEAILCGNMDVAELFLEKGQADVNIDGRNGESPVMVAVSRGQLDFVKMLHKRGADLNKCDACGISPVYKALHRGWVDIASFLFLHHCDVNKTAANGRTCLYAAAHSNKIKNQFAVKHLLRTGYDFRKDAEWMLDEGCPVSSETDASLHRKILERAGLKPPAHKTSFIKNGRRKFVKTIRRFSAQDSL